MENSHMPEKIVLASKSPRRAELLRLLGIQEFDIIASNIDEDAIRGASPDDTAQNLALAKAEAVAAALLPETPLVIGADTLVYLDGCPMGKPIDESDAAAMLRKLSNRRHSVYTGVALIRGGKKITAAERTDVYFRKIHDDEIETYIKTGEPFDKAGAYGAQGHAAPFIKRIEGDFWNVVGLPLCRLSQLLREFEP